jgi:excisionase family DNA binding protein
MNRNQRRSAERQTGREGPLAHSIEEARAQLGICRDGIYGLIRAGKLRAKKLGRRTIITDDDLRDCVARLPSAGGEAG